MLLVAEEFDVFPILGILTRNHDKKRKFESNINYRSLGSAVPVISGRGVIIKRIRVNCIIGQLGINCNSLLYVRFRFGLGRRTAFMGIPVQYAFFSTT